MVTETICLLPFVILGIPVSYQDVSSIDPEYAKNLQVGSSNHVLLFCINALILSLLLL